MKFSFFKKIFRSFPVFLAAFVIISLAADISFLDRKTTFSRGEAGWDGMPDFKVFWQAGNVMAAKIRGKGDAPGSFKPLYDKEEVFYHFRYSPASALVMVPFGVIPYPRIAMLIWLLLGNAVFLSALLVLAEHVRKKTSLGDVDRCFMLWIMFLGTLRYYLVVISQGQTDGVIVFLLVLLLVSYVQKKDILAGILFAVILQIKPFFIPLGFLFIVEKRYRAILSAFILIAAFIFIPSVLLGIRETLLLTKEWILMVASSVPSQVMNYKNQSLSYGAAVALFRLTGLENIFSAKEVIGALSVVFTAIAFGFFLFRGKYLKARFADFYEHFAVSFIVAVSVIFSPISWEAYYLFLMIPLSLVFTQGIKEHKKKTMVLYLAGYFILTYSAGTDITKFIPGLNNFRFINISLGAVLLILGMFKLSSAKPVDLGV